MMKSQIFTIGHSTHTYERFLSLLKDAEITAIADVRTSPFSKHFPQFNRETMKDELRMDGIVYSFLGNELGGRPRSSEFYCDGVADYERMAKSPQFQQGIQRVLEGTHKYRIALMCSEHDPFDCHRCLLVGRALAERNIPVKHIKGDGSIADHRDIEQQLLESEGQDDDDLFLSSEERLANAYRRRARKVAYAEQSAFSSGHAAAE